MARQEIVQVSAPIFKLDLPKPSDILISAVKEFVSTVELDFIDATHLKTFHGYDVNYANYTFSRSSLIDDIVRTEYQEFFPDSKISTIIAIMQNTKSIPACVTPHIDSRRSLAMNYYIELGGTNVITSFYDTIKQARPDEGQQYRYDQVTKVDEYCFESNQWYAFQGNQCHSVENIQGTRIALIILKETDHGNLDIVDLFEKNTHIIATQIKSNYNKY